MENNWAKEIKNSIGMYNEKVDAVNKVFENIVASLEREHLTVVFRLKEINGYQPIWVLQILTRVEEFKAEDLALGKNDWWKDEKKLEEKIQNAVLERFKWEI